jgi:hypothetical protein
MTTRCVVLLVCGLLLASRPLHAEPVTLKLLGSLDFVSGDIGHALSVGDGFEVTLSYDTDAPFFQFLTFREYDTGAASWSFAGYSGDAPIVGSQGPMSSLISDTRIHVELDSGLVSRNPASTVLPGAWGLRALYFFYDDAATTPGELPTVVNPGASMSFAAYYSRLGPDGRVGDSAALSATGVTTHIRRVPEPSTALLLVAGGLVLTGWRTARGRWRPAPHR